MSKSRNPAVQQWADRTYMGVNGVGSGPLATPTLTRDQDIAAFDAMCAARPMKPPGRRLQPREPLTVAKTGVAESCVQPSKSSPPPARAIQGAEP